MASDDSILPPRQGGPHQHRRRSVRAEIPAWSAPVAEDAGKTRYVLLLTQFTRGKPPVLNWDVYHEVVDEVRTKVNTAPELTEIDVWLDSPGGDINAAYKIAFLLRVKSSRLRVVVPDHAKSAATLLALAADEIYMSDSAELGPIDPQIDAWQDGRRMSARHVVNSTQFIVQSAVRTTLATGAAILEETRLSRDEAWSIGASLSSSLFSGILSEKISPSSILEAENLLDMSANYADNLLLMRETKGAVNVKKLVRSYPDHNFVIDWIEAFDEIGLPVHLFGSYADSDTREEILALHRHLRVNAISRVEIRATGPAEPFERLISEPLPSQDLGPAPETSSRHRRDKSAADNEVWEGRSSTSSATGHRDSDHDSGDGDHTDTVDRFVVDLTHPVSDRLREARSQAWRKAAREGR